ncbi:MAG TPA: ABC transporter ATP-binding protein [Streptosporangiaceae bacterium]|nr:ABC transporter ATP-binding protein [Streptosporangiaceae bacterium]
MAPLLEITDLRTEIRLRTSVVRALDGVSMSVSAGECLGLVGESGSGKTITALSVLRLLPPGGVITGGRVSLDGTDLVSLTAPDLRQVRGSDIGMIFQDPASALNPVMTIGAQVAEPLELHRGMARREALRRAEEVLGLVQMPEPQRVMARYPHELSGGMRQRAMIAIALVCEPRLLIADEPTTALDVTIQRQILDLIDDLRQRLQMAVILVTHDLGVIGAHSDRVAVMYGGQIVESASTATVFASPRHPYTEALFDALPEMAPAGLAGAGGRTLYSIPGQPPDLTAPMAGCRFAPRCRRASDFCVTREPALDGDHPGHVYACFYPVEPRGRAAADGRAAGGAGPLVSAWDRPAGRAQPGAAPAPGGLPDGIGMPGNWPYEDRSAAVSPFTGEYAIGQFGGMGQPGTAGPEPVLRVSGLVKNYPVYSGAVVRRATGEVSAVAGVSFDITPGQTFGLVGESGCGKTTLARLLAGLEQADAGSIAFRGTDLTALSRGQRRKAGTGIQLMFQDPFGSLDPRMRVGTILREPLIIAKAGRKRSHWRTVARFLDEVGMPADSVRRFPREFSGGQRQRLALARALILQPDLIVADEPVSALDVSVQAQILNLMRRLQRQYGLSYLFISHDLSVVRYMADVIGVMYLGKMVEIGPAEMVCTVPAHPYTRGLIDAVPVVALSAAGRHPGQPIAGEQPVTARPPSGCRFRTRCPLAAEICAVQEPPLRPTATGGQLVACHFPLHGSDAGPGGQGSPGQAGHAASVPGVSAS